MLALIIDVYEGEVVYHLINLLDKQLYLMQCKIRITIFFPSMMI